MTASGLTRVSGSARVRWPSYLRTPAGLTGLGILILVVAVAVIGPSLAPHPLDAPVGQPGSGASGRFPLGLDFLGRDVLSRVLYGGRSVLVLACVTMMFTYLIGVSIGTVAGLSRSAVDSLLMRVVDVFLVFPPMLLLLLLIASGGTSEAVLVVGIVLVLAPGVARIVRSATLALATSGYVEAAFGRGESTAAVVRREILPNIASSLLADLGVRFSGAIILAAGVSFLGLGAKPPAASWGLMISENRAVVATNIWSLVVPAVLLALLTISVNLLSDAYVRTLGRSNT